MRRFLRKEVSIPNWAALALLVASLVAVFGVYFALDYRGEAKRLENVEDIYRQYLQDTEQGERFQEWLKAPRSAGGE